MNTLSQIKEKISRKYNFIDRNTQAKILEEVVSHAQRDLAEKYDIPRTTLQHWIERKEKLKGQADSNVVIFFESSSGQAWLHKMILGTFAIFHKNGNSGIPDLSEYFEMIGVNMFVGTSISALQKVSKSIDKQLFVFRSEETDRLAQNMPHKEIPGALDENFIMDEMTLILMDPISGFILAEEIEEKRDAETWNKVIQASL